MKRPPASSRRDRLLLPAASLLGAAVIRGLSLTWRRELHFEVPPRTLPLGYNEPAVFVTWHRRMFAFFDFFGRRHVGVMISLSRDGEIVSRAAGHLGFRPLRGSSSRGAVRGMRALLRRLRAGRPVGFLLDGPRGPVHRAKMGAVAAARDRGAPLVPVAFSASQAWVLRSWDRYIVPRPRARVVLLFGAPLRVPSGAGPRALEDARRRLEDEVHRLCRKADDMTGGPCRFEGAP